MAYYYLNHNIKICCVARCAYDYQYVYFIKKITVLIALTGICYAQQTN